VCWQGKLLACKEDSPPYALDPETLETIGLWDFDAQLPSLTFTAHPKFDPVTRDMVCFDYEAKAERTQDVCYYTMSPSGKMKEIVWFEAPVCGMMHDFGVTKNYVSHRCFQGLLLALEGIF
jgi:carotenoid cleavage dioxygenase-like enzyme